MTEKIEAADAAQGLRWFQKPPSAPDWRFWGVVGDRNVGKSYAGAHLVANYAGNGASVLIMGNSPRTETYMLDEIQRICVAEGWARGEASRQGGPSLVFPSGGVISAVVRPMNGRQFKADLLWADEDRSTAPMRVFEQMTFAAKCAISAPPRMVFTGEWPSAGFPHAGARPDVFIAQGLE